MAAGKSDFDLHQDVAEGLDLIAVGEEMLPSYNIPTFFIRVQRCQKKWPETLLTQIVTAPIFFPRIYF